MATLNLQVLDDRRIRAGLSQADLARELGVSREAVSTWFSGEKFPQPAKLLRLGMALGLEFDDFVQVVPPTPVPVVRFRKKAARKTRPEDVKAAMDRAALLERLVAHLPARPDTRPPTLREPVLEYAYVQRVAAEMRSEMNIDACRKVEFKDLIGKFSQLSAVVIPVLWGAQKEHGNALHAYLPGSCTAWIFLNLDSNAIDFNFWMAHELGHSLAPSMEEDDSEAFADAFAQAFLYPESAAREIRSELEARPTIGARINRIRDEAASRTISPWTVRKAVQLYEAEHDLPRVDLGLDRAFGGAVSNFGKGYRTMSEALFKDRAPSPAEFVAKCREFFHTPFFDALAAYCRAESGGEHFIHSLLGLPPSDAKALAGELRG